MVSLLELNIATEASCFHSCSKEDVQLKLTVLKLIEACNPDLAYLIQMAAEDKAPMSAHG
jgi:hypothetical protein